MLRLLLALLGTHVVHAFAKAVTGEFSCWMPRYSCTVMGEEIAGFKVVVSMLEDFMRNLLVDFDYDTYIVLVVVLTGAAVALLQGSLRLLHHRVRILVLLTVGATIGAEAWFAEWGYNTNFRPETHQWDLLVTSIATFAAAAMLTWWAIRDRKGPNHATLAAAPASQPNDAGPVDGQGRKVVVVGILLVIGVALSLAFLESERHRERVGSRPPVLTLRVGDQTLDGWHGDHVWDGGPMVDAFLIRVRGPALRVLPGAQLTATTSSHLGAPAKASAFLARSSLPGKCDEAEVTRPDDQEMCFDYDPAIPVWHKHVPVVINSGGTLSLAAPTELGAYRLSVEAWWPDELGGGSQWFAIEVRR